MPSAAEQLAANLNFGAFAKADELKKRIWFTLGALLVYRLGTYIPLPGIDPNIWEQVFKHPGRRHPRHVQHVRRRRHPPHGDLRAEHHAVHLGIDHHPALDHRLAAARSAEEGRRGRPQDAEPVHPLSHRDPRRIPVLRHRRRSRGRRQRRLRSRIFLPHLHRGDADRRHHVPDVARRADYVTRYRQRYLADHSLRHRRRIAVGARQHARARPPGRTVDRFDPDRDRDGGRRDRLHRVHGACAAPTPDPVSEAPGRQQDVRGPVLASAAQAQHLGRDPADLRLVAAAVADHDRQLQRRQGVRNGSSGSPPSSATAVRCSCSSISR